MSLHNHICGLYYLIPSATQTWNRAPERRYLSQLSLSVHARIIGSTSRTTLTQTFTNPSPDKAIPELRYTFPLYDGVSVVGFSCTINRDRVIKGVVKERAQARKTFEDAVARGETAGLFEQLPDASDVFTTTIGNVPSGAEIKVEITYLGELKHDAEADGIRFTIPTSIAPRYGSYPGEMLQSTNVNAVKGISIIVDAEVPDGSNIKSVQSPSHPISVTIGNTSAGAASGADMSLQKASATLSMATAELGQDFVLHVVATNTANPVAVLETHPTIPNHRALMATLVPKFNLPSSRPEIVFLCDRSGSMCSGNKIPNMKTALQVFLKSLPVGVKFNICSFGSHHELLFKKGSKSYDAASLKEASSYVDKFDSNFGGTEMYQPLEDIFKRRFKDMNLEVFLLTDGEIWDQERLFGMINEYIEESKGAIRVFTLGIGSDVSHALIGGVARAGNGFSQAVGDNENMNSKVVRMLKASLTPHIKDYTLEVKYAKEAAPVTDDDFEIVEKVMDAMVLDVQDEPKPEPKKTISLFDTSANPDAEVTDASLDKTADGKYSHVPPVSEPKLLQTPSTIPPLFPFNRTSVYLLMSSESTQKTPKSVVLRGTSSYGPLELEIPVTVLTEKGETIHQLAARQAVKELEEGRGWLYHAKDGSGPKAKLLKDKFEGRFSDMVEREAVRLGVRYQVGGKWCSFVAVDSENEKKKREDPDSGSIAPPAYASSNDESGDEGFGLFDSGPSVYPSAAPAARNRSGGPSLARFAQRSLAPGVGGGGFSNSSIMSCERLDAESGAPDFSAPPPPPACAPALTSNSMYGGAPQVQTLSLMSSAPPPAPMAKRKGGAGPTSFLHQARGALGGSRREKSDDSAKESRGGGGFIKMFKKSAKDTASPRDSEEEEGGSRSVTPLPTDALEAIVAKQSFEGSWTWGNGDLLAALGLDVSGLGTKLRQLDAVLAPGTDLAATAVVLAYLEAKLAGKKEEWEMMAEKGMEWLDEELKGKSSAAGLVEKVKGILV
ncbi:von Willebrand factor type A domain-containing protein [Immersiella caudata]|uniref:von Willebrand factor type A domain-containing protein n=1 Tax=Immersiella caudata TaxID=314043 RepID=A0AA39XF96_9PEZI|nr:von Willebrand factor type A domain-containing protein [Immersiella caudata]